jgi:hypothetical protein
VAIERLADGWGSDSPPDDTLTRLYVEEYADLVEALGRACGWATERTEGFVAADARAPFPFLNIAVLRRPLQGADDPLLADVADVFGADHETPFLLWSATPTPSFAELGWTLVGHPPLMFRPPGGAAPATPRGLHIVEVRDPTRVDQFERTLIDAFPIPEMAGQPIFGPAGLHVPDWRMWLALLEGEPVGTAAAHAGRIVDVEWISTRSEHRGRGIGAALTWAATLTKRDRPAMLIASDDGRPVYERMGYYTLSRCTLWVGIRQP